MWQQSSVRYFYTSQLELYNEHYVALAYWSSLSQKAAFDKEAQILIKIVGEGLQKVEAWEVEASIVLRWVEI